MIKTSRVGLDVQRMRDTGIIIEFVGKEPADEGKTWLATGTGKRSAQHVKDPLLQTFGFLKALDNGACVQCIRSKMCT